MSQDFRSRYGELRANDPTGPEQDRQVNAVSENYPTQSNTRNVIFERSDGRRFFLNYSYLVFCEEVEAGTSIVLLFTTHTVRLSGLRLNGLLDDLVNHSPKTITATDARYNATLSEDGPVINEIVLIPNS